MPLSPSRRPSPLGPDDWVDAGLAALRRSGPAAVAIEPLARSLGATKGSGYWHFASRDDLLAAVLQRWRQVATEHVIHEVEQLPGSPSDRLRALLDVVTSASIRSPGELLVVASQEDLVRAAVSEVTSQRIGYVAGLLVDCGLARGEARRRAVVAYAAYLGFATLAAATPEALPTSRSALSRLQASVTDLLTRLP